MAKILIDTNAFIRKLRVSHIQIKKFLETLLQEKDNYCFTEQIIDEFFRNIDEKANEYKKELADRKHIRNLETMSDFFKKEKSNEKYNTLHAEMSTMIEQRYQEKERSIEKVAWELKNFFEQLKNNKFFIIKRTDEIIQRANNRNLCGNPPQSKASSKAKIGDEIIWESVLQGLNADLIIVSDDSTFTENIGFLKREFDNDNRKLIDVVKNIEAARALIDLPKDRNIEKIEKKIEIEEQKQEVELESSLQSLFKRLDDFPRYKYVEDLKYPSQETFRKTLQEMFSVNHLPIKLPIEKITEAQKKIPMKEIKISLAPKSKVQQIVEGATKVASKQQIKK